MNDLLTVRGIKPGGWPRFSAIDTIITKDQYRALQAGGTERIDAALGRQLIAMGVCEEGRDANNADQG